MRLMDAVCAAPPSLHVESRSRLYEIPGASAHRDELQACPVRYVLDDNVAELCRELLETDRGMLVPENALLRLPLENFWIEWHERSARDGGPEWPSPRSVGVLVQAAPDGRSGSLRTFWKNEAGAADCGQVYIEFDLDRGPVASAQPCFLAHHCELPEFQPLLDCMSFRLEPAWSAYFADLEPLDRHAAAARCCAMIWLDLAFAFVFATVLGARGGMQAAPSDLARLNRSRVRRGKPELLEHVEARLLLGPADTDAVGVGSAREAPRLHQVRGHLVRRSNTTFWRTTHLRGDPGTVLLRRTVRVGRKP